MPISVVGSWRRDRGFTLIELVVVLVILGVVALVALPRLGGFADSYLRSSARRLAGMIRYTQSRAALSGKEYRLYYDLDKGEYWLSGPGEEDFEEEDVEGKRRRHLLEGVRFRNIITRSGGRVSGGVASSRFSPQGWVEGTSIHLQDERGEELFVLIKGPGGRVRILEEDER